MGRKTMYEYKLQSIQNYQNYNFINDEIKLWKSHFSSLENKEDKVKLVGISLFKELYEQSVMALLEENIDTKEVQKEIIKSRRIIMNTMAQHFDEVGEIEAYVSGALLFPTPNSPKSYAPKCKLKYLGGDNEDYTEGGLYRIVNIDNWFHDKNELGYYITNDEYIGDDEDYCTFFPMGDLRDNFEYL